MKTASALTRRAAALLAAVISIASLASAQQEVGYIEEFALAENREEALKQLIPGTEDYYYFHALHYQNTGQKAGYDAVMGQWAKRFKSSNRRRVIERRQALLNYGKDPKGSLEFIRREMGLTFNHQQEGKAQERDYPNRLDQKEVSWDSFLNQALSGTSTLSGLTDEAFHPLLAMGRDLSVAERRDLLSRAQLPDLPGLVALINTDLGTKESRGFGEFKIHGLLTIAQLDELRALRGDLLRNQNYVHTYLGKLRPGPDHDPVTEVAVRQRYLDRAWAFVKDLDPVFNSLKAHVLYQRLEFDRSLGVRDQGRFMTYVKLPRNVGYIRTDWRNEAKELWKNPADCNRDFGSVTGLPRIGSDEALVRDYLLYFLKEAADYKAYSPYISEGWLRAVFAETKIVNGVGDPERWTSMLSPAAFQALKDRVDLEFDPAHRTAAGKDGKPAANADRFGVNETVRLRLHVKNVPKLIVKVFELNPLNYYLENGKELSTDVNLDGLVANIERTIEYADAPARRIARDFAFPEIGNRRGVWVVEFIGGGQSSRAVIRKGGLELLSENGPGGVKVTVLDESREPLGGAGVWFGGRKVTCNDNGQALIPYSTNPGNRTLVLEDGSGFASLATLAHPAEQYRLAAGFHVDREALRSGARATLAVRPLLQLAGRPVSLKQLSDVRLVLTAIDQDGVTTTTTVDDFKIWSDREATHELRIPDRLSSLSATLRAKVKVASQGGQEQELSASKSFVVNQQMRTDQVDDLFLSRIGRSYVLEFLGRTGEARGGRNVNVQFNRPGFTQPRSATLKTNAAGAIDLGALDGISGVSATTPNGRQQQWSLATEARSQRGTLHGVEGAPLKVPFLGKLTRSEVALFSVAGNTYLTDEFAKLKLERGFLVAEGLKRGDYFLHLKDSRQSLVVRVAAGKRSGNHVFNPARTLELDSRPPAHLVGMEAGKESLTIEVANVDEFTRVHVVATRFLPEHSLFRDLGGSGQPGLYRGQSPYLPNLYLSGRRIGDEFRYILERRYAEKLPGNMLERPELLLNPWAVRETESGQEELRAQEAYDRRATGRGGFGQGGGEADPFASKGGARSGPSPEFLRHDPVTLWNLRPDKDGKMSVKLDAFGDRQHIHVLVLDPAGATYRSLSLADRGTAVRDLRLLNALDPEKQFTEQDSVTLMKAGDELVIGDILTARFETFDDLGAAYRYLLALSQNPLLREFSFVTDWAGLEEGRKRELYSKYACHELSFFLQRKDPEFFKTVVVPHLANKKDRTFMDDYLLGSDLAGYLEAYEYDRLNVPERILLARSVKGRIDAIRMDLRDRIALRPPNLARETELFEGALATFGMSGERRNAIDKAKSNLAREYELEIADEAPAAEAAPAPPRTPALRKRLSEVAEKKEAEESLRLERDRKVAQEKGKAQAESRYRLDADDAVDPFGDFDNAVPAMKAFFREIEKTKEWAENNYYHLPIEAQDYSLVTDNKFWLDFARHEGDSGFGSRHLGEAARNFPEIMLALAVLDLPFEAKEHKLEIEGARMSFTAGSPLMAFHREIKEAKMAVERPPLLVSQSYFRNDDRYRMENGEKVDKFVTEEFVAGVVYGGQTVVTNPTSSRQKLDVLVQIPRGAMPVLGKRATGTRRISLEPYSTERFEVFFYFPTVGDFACYPAHVSKAGQVVANAKPMTFKVVDKLSKVDKTSWAYISQWGTPEEVLAYLAEGNLHAVPLDRIAWRCREDRGFTLKVLDLLTRRGIYEGTLFSYGLMHNHAPAVRELLLMQKGYLDGCGRYLDSALVTLDPIQRRAYQHLEYKPLVNNRAHRVGADYRILNDRIRGQYQQFLQILSEKPKADDMDLMSTAYYLFLQDRASEAMARLAAVDPKELPTRMQYDYFQAYAAFYRSQPDEARRIAKRYADYPVDRWRERFAAVVAQAEEITGDDPEVNDDESRDQQQEALASQEAALAMKVDGDAVILDYQNLKNVQVNYYEMDLEFLFSTTPFVSSDGGGFSIVKPNRSTELRLPAGKRTHRFQLPRDYQARNVLVEVVGGGKKRSQAVYANELQTIVSESFGILTVRHEKTGRPLSKAYVKVYAMTAGGPKFYKDGYTDLRGKFDYATVSTTDIGSATKFSVLVMSEENGATVLEAPVPQR